MSRRSAEIMAKKTLVLNIDDSASITIEESSGAIRLKTKSGAKIEVTSDGITLDNGQGAKLVLSGSKVDVNDGALTVV
jgi:hypothetical protein